MAERKAVNKYYPPDWDPSKGSVNKYVGQHPLRDRAKKLSQGILVIRFEMPYNIWCGGCNAHIGMGVRYNAEKTKTGNYYSTPIYKFRMKCHLCDNYFEIQTDPKNHDYVILEGARRKEQRWDPKENEQIVPEDKATQKKIATDAMFKLEHGTDDKQRGKKAVSNLAQLETSKEGMKDDYILNKIARNKFREEKKALKKVQEDDNALLTKSSLSIPLVKETEEDVKLAGLMRLKAVETYDERQVQKRKEIESRPIFRHKKRAVVDDSGSPQTKKLKIIRDNILNAKANFSTSPFDRMKTNTLGIGLTQDQLGIRKRTSKSIRYSNTDTVSTNKDETCGNDIYSFSSEKNVSATKNVCISVSDSKCEERTGYHSLTERDTEEIIEENNVEPVGQRTVCDAIENKTVLENNHVEYDTSNENFCHNDFTDISNCQSEKRSESILNKDFASNGHRTLDNDNQFVQVENNFKVLDSNVISSPSLSLVAAYSDSEDTDTSTG